MLLNSIRDLREDNDLSQRNLAEYLQIHQTTYSDYELGNLNVSVHILIKLADFYKTSIDYIVGYTDVREPRPKAKRH